MGGAGAGVCGWGRCRCGGDGLGVLGEETHFVCVCVRRLVEGGLMWPRIDGILLQVLQGRQSRMLSLGVKLNIYLPQPRSQPDPHSLHRHRRHRLTPRASSFHSRMEIRREES
jgi:hypothetical protein